MQQHIAYLEWHIRSLEQKQTACGIETAPECVLLHDLLRLVRKEDDRLEQVKHQLSLRCHMARLTTDLLGHLMRRFLIDSEILALTLCNKHLYSHFYALYLEMVAPRRQSGPVPVTGTHTRHFWYTIPARVSTPTTKSTGGAQRPTTDRCYRCQRAGHVSRDCPFVACKHCGRKGHFESDCPQKVTRRVQCK